MEGVAGVLRQIQRAIVDPARVREVVQDKPTKLKQLAMVDRARDMLDSLVVVESRPTR